MYVGILRVSGQGSQLTSMKTGPELGTDGSQKRVSGSTVWKFYCGKWVKTSQGLVKPPYTVANMQKCLDDCEATPSCQSIYYGFANTLAQNRVGECNLVGGVENGTPSGIHADFIAAIPETLRPVIAIPMRASDTCGGLGADGLISREEGGITYKFFCGKYVTNNNQLVKPGYKVASLQACLQDCNATPACKSIYYGLSTAGARAGECDLVTITQNTPTGISADFVAAIPVPAK